MPQIGNDIRSLIITHFLSGTSAAVISSTLRCSRYQVYRVIKAYEENGRQTSRKRGGAKPKCLTDEHIDYINDLIDEDCSITLKQIKAKLSANKQVDVSESSISKQIKAFNYSFKRVGLVPERRNADDVIENRAQYVADICRLIALDRTVLLFLDETGFNVSMRSIYGRASLNSTPKKKVRAIHSKNLSMSCCISRHEIIFYEVQEVPYNRESYGGYLSRLFAVLCEKNLQGCTFVLDNVPFHRSAIIQQSIRAFGHCVLYLPAYSPFLNPIEEVFSKIKTIVRRSEPTNVGDLLEKIRSAANQITREDCIGYFEHTKDFFDVCLNREQIV